MPLVLLGAQIVDPQLPGIVLGTVERDEVSHEVLRYRGAVIHGRPACTFGGETENAASMMSM